MAEKKYGTMTKTLAYAEGIWAKNHVKLAREPQGERAGVVQYESDSNVSSLFPPYRVAMVGDSMSVGCGVSDQHDGLVPDIARELSTTLQRDVEWSTFGKLGATMRRVRYRLIPQMLETLGNTDSSKAQEKIDLLYICAGSNDLMASRTPTEFLSDLGDAIDEVKPFAKKIIVLSPGQLYLSPSLGPHLRRILYYQSEKLTSASAELCLQKGVTYLNMTHERLITDSTTFYASDHFHPGKIGYQLMAKRIVELEH